MHGVSARENWNTTVRLCVHASTSRDRNSTRDWDARWVKCDICNKEVADGYLNRHLETVHDVYRSKILDVDLNLSKD